MREKNEEKIPTSIILQLVVSLFSSIHIFLCFLGSHSSAAREEKEPPCGEQKIKRVKLWLVEQ